MSPDDDDWREDPGPDLPSLGPDVPEVDVPEVDASSSLTAEGAGRIARLFWRLVVVLDVGLLAVSVGLMFVYFEGNWLRGLALSGFGVAVLAYGAVRYRRYRADAADGVDGPGDEGESPVDEAEDGPEPER